ncbi:dTDP-3,4-didehydro-2,6-dideoxy-alpha-D-glucose 3-reductase [Propionicimonas sp. T2.31MG-18]|uniref:Gfo/Idh/MocA family protein n=1 Tax=Propionicimonas sp. T2.31MG-18 TaxID=3157620 RepID=UPI0035E96B43
MTTTDKVRWGVLGVSWVNQLTLPGMTTADNAELVAIASFDDDRAREESARWGAQRWYRGFDALLADPDVEAVYLPLPNTKHSEWTIRALEAGKHVLCEKPLTPSSAEIERLIETSRRTGRLVMEALMYRFTPRWQRALQLIRDGAVGDPRVARLGLAFKQHYEGYNIRFDPDAAGGVVWDMGCYAVDMARELLPGEIRTVTATSWSRPGERVETSAEAILGFDDGRKGLINVSFDYPNPYAQAELIGTDGWLTLPGSGMRGEPYTRLLWHTYGDEVFLDGVEPNQESFPRADAYRLEVEHLSDCIRTGQQVRYPLERSLANTQVLEAIFESAASGTTVGLD